MDGTILIKLGFDEGMLDQGLVRIVWLVGWGIALSNGFEQSTL